MREILFRGKDALDGTWVFGDLIAKPYGCNPIIVESAEMDDYGGTAFENTVVKPETVGQYTGLKDKNGKMIFEGDIVSMPRYRGGKRITNVYFRDGKFAVDGSNYGFKDIAAGHMEVIGNIYDNHELLEGN